MHPDKFLKRSRRPVTPPLSDAEKSARLESLGQIIAGKRKDAVVARKVSGIEDVWMACEEAYLGIDDQNRHEFATAKWAKPTSMSGPLTSTRKKSDNLRSNVYVRLSSRYADNATAKMCEILLPIDDKAFSLDATPDPVLVKQKDDLTPFIDEATGQPAMRPLKPDEAASAVAVPTQAPMQGAAQPPSGQIPTPMVPMTKGDAAEAAIAAAAESADKAERRIYDWMVESNYPAEVRKVVADAARIGVGVLKGPFPDVKQSRAMTKINGGVALQIENKIIPAVSWVDPWNIFPDDSCGEDIHTGDGIFERDFLSKKTLKSLKDQEGYLADQIDLVIEEGPGKIYAEGSNPSDRNKLKSKRFEIWYYYGTLKRADMELAGAAGIEDLPKDKQDVHAVVSMVNDRIIRAVINPLDSGAYPYRAMSWSRRPGSWAGVGPIEQMSSPQRMCNAATRALLNNAGLSSGPQIIIDREGIVPADGSWVLYPGKVWHKTGDSTSDDVRKAFYAAQIPSVQEEMMAIITYAMKLAEESTGIPLITQGQTGPTTPDTFGATELQDNNAHSWLRSIAARFDDMITEPLVRDYYEWLLLDPDVPDEEKGDFQINAHGSTAMAERAIQEQTLMTLLNAAANPAFRIDPAKLFAEYLKAKRLDPRNIQYSEEEQEKMAQQPAPPPIPVQVAQIKAQTDLQKVQEQGKVDAQLQAGEHEAALQQVEHEAAQEQQLLQSGGTMPHMAAATARIEEAKIRATTAENVEASRAHAEAARADKEMLIAQQNGQFEIQKMQLQKELAILEYSAKHNLTLDQVKAELAKTAMQEETKRQLAATEQALAASEGDKNRMVDVHKHHTPPASMVRDEMSTPNTP